MDVHTWLREALNQPGVSLEPITSEIAIDSSSLPGDPRGDPADRILVATARALNATLVTKDQQMNGPSIKGYK